MKRRVWGISSPVDNREDRFGRGFIPPPHRREFFLTKHSAPNEYGGNSYLNQKRDSVKSEQIKSNFDRKYSNSYNFSEIYFEAHGSLILKTVPLV